MSFEKNQILIHQHYGECIALRAWNDFETFCLVTRTGRRQILHNCFLKPVLGPGPNDRNIAVVSDETVEQFEKERSGH